MDMASSFNKFLNTALKSLHQVSGRSAKTWQNRANVMNESQAKKFTASRANRMAFVEKSKTQRARIKTGVGAGAVIGTGFLGVHKYHQHQDNKILRRIDNMYGIQ